MTDAQKKEWLCATDMCEVDVFGIRGALITGTMGEITTFGLRTGCILSDGGVNPLLQDLRGKSRSMSKKI